MSDAHTGADPITAAVATEDFSAHGGSPALPPKRRLTITFTGSGSEYFRIWIVNILLTLLTLGLYLPFAKVRRIKYFYANTLVDGEALSFHGRPWPMFRGFVLLLALMAAYGIASKFSPTAGLLAYLLLCAMWPALWRAGMQFRLSNTAWRGLRFGFSGDLRSAYLAFMPVYLPAIGLMAAQYFVLGGATQASSPEELEKLGASVELYSYISGACGLLMLGLAPWSLACVKRYQHNGYRYAEEQTRLDIPNRRFYGLGLKVLLIGILPLMLIGVLAAILLPMVKGRPETLPVVFIALFLAYLFFFAVSGPLFNARLQNLVWTGTRSASLQFDSQLKARRLIGLTFKNWLLTALSLSLYRPFAAVATARLRLQSVGVDLDGDLDRWVAPANAGQNDATGEAAGDFFGFDMGW
ncbi:uncharacterized membrane protein YjgN (DUF898 family) [Paucibacter oligotrophus]|uniref:Uncharacterized membrane protein YjgN (DUF898 family) n=1 Tax=Roseateles oligotrophus TaxID=1769250 RepID=A0A840L9E3_9BURK|nr:YjgN family protein [Roseateles oligotrophus]MBB4842808.1 uncharacterized membrane protein YjgN (DUF898 family) [Roseateles oligotrophus]